MSGDARWSTCVLCPRLCRTSCPVATGTAREAAVPSFLAEVLSAWERGEVADDVAREAATLCTACGACQDRCHLHRPLPQYLAETRSRLLPPPAMEPLAPIEGSAELVAIEADERPFAATLARSLDRPVARWVTRDRFGVAAIEHPVWARRAEHLRELAGARQLVVVDGGVAHALDGAGIGFRWLHDLDRSLTLAAGSCRTGGARPLSCCGGAGPLAAHHPEDAARVARVWLDRAWDGRVLDGRCRGHLVASGGAATDPLDELIGRMAMQERPGRPM